jgi:hypothetical protein
MVLSAGEARAVTLHVAPGGSDAAAGTSGQPLATLEGARDRVRQLRKAGALREAVTVAFADGEYALDKPVAFEPEDSGNAEAPVTYTAAKGAKPVFFGGKRLPPFEAGADGVWRTRVEPAFRFEQLYVNGRRAVRARSPNAFYYYMQAPAPFGVDPLTGKVAELGRRAFIAAKADLAPLAGKSREQLSDVVMTVYHAWEASHARLQAVELETGRVVATGSSPWKFFYWGTYLPRYHLENFKEALDAPGEWFLDRDGTLSYLPLPGEKIKTAEAVAPVTSAFVLVRGDAAAGKWITHLTFSGLTFLYARYELPENGQGDGQAAVTQPAVVELDGARQVAFRDCTVAHTGTHGIWFRKGCREGALERCHIYDLGGGAVRIGDYKWSKDELPDRLTGKITVDNNILQQGGRFFHGATGVWIGHASDVRVTHNDIGDFFYTGISMGWTWGYHETATHRNTLAFNHIHHLGWGVLSDMGGVYTLGRSEGTAVTNNHIHDVYSYDYSGRGGWGLYTDEGSARMVFENNLVHHTKTGNIHQHYGQENVFRNNILACSRDGQIQRSRIEDHTTVIITNNIIWWDNPSAAFWRGHVGAYGTVTDVVVNANTYWNPHGIATNAFNGVSFEAWQALGQDTRSQIADPLFRDAAKGDFRLKSGSPAVKAGFVPFDYTRAGVYGSRAWRKLAAAKPYPAVTFAPVPERYVVRRLNENFDGLPLKVGFPNVATHVEKKGDSLSVTDETAFSGKQSLKVQDAPGLTYSYNPHFTFSCAFTNAVVENRFALRMQAGADFFTEWRDYPADGGNGYATGPCLTFREGKVSARARSKKADGSFQAADRLIAEIPADTWVQVTVTASVGGGAEGQWSVKVARPGQPDVEVTDLYVSNPAWKAMEWLGFCSTAKSAVAYYLDDFVFGTKEEK